MKHVQPPSNDNRDYERDFGYVSRKPPEPPRMEGPLGWIVVLILAFAIMIFS